MEIRKARMASLLRYLKKTYHTPKTELKYRTPFQLAVAVMLSAQCTDKLVNKVTLPLFKKYKSPVDFATAEPRVFEREIAQISFFRTKARHVRESARILVDEHKGKLPRTAAELQKLPGIGYKTAHVILGEIYDIWEGIPTDTHVKRFARKFDLTDHTDLNKISKDLEMLVPKKDWKYVNNGFVLYGRYICKANKHDCSEHPLTKLWPPAASRWPSTRAQSRFIPVPRRHSRVLRQADFRLNVAGVLLEREVAHVRSRSTLRHSFLRASTRSDTL